MHTKSINFQSFVEWDNSPFILFSNQGKILYLNQSAEILFGYVSQRELYNIALSYAPKDFGYKTTTLALAYHIFAFHSLSVGYENEEEISLRLYHQHRQISSPKRNSNTLISTDINILLEANIALFRSKNKNKLQLLTDPDIPNFKIEQNTCSKILRKALDAFIFSDSIEISLKILVSQYLLIENQKISIVELRIQGDRRLEEKDKDILNLCVENHINCFFSDASDGELRLEIPLFLE